MEENQLPEQASADEQEAARKREEAVRRVENMLESTRREKLQTELNLLSSHSRHPRTYVVRSEREALDPMAGLLTYDKPEKPLAEMTPEEQEAEQKRAEAIQRVNMMMIQQRGEYNSSRSVTTVFMPKARKPVEKNSVDIADFLSQYKLSPEAQARFEEIRYGGAKKGIVRPSLLVRFATVVAAPMLLFIAWVLGQFQSMSVMQPVFIILAVLVLCRAYYDNTWKLEFDSDTGFVRYHSMFHGTNLYEMKELMNYVITPQPEKPFPFSLLGLFDPRQYLVIRLPDHTVNIPLLFSATVLTQVVELAGYDGASDLSRCLEQYERDLYKKAASEQKASVSAPQGPAAPEDPAPLQKPAPAPAPDKRPVLQKPAATAPEPPEAKPVPKPDPVDLAKAREMFAKPAASAFSMPERSDAFPDPAKNSAFPDPAQKPKPDVDVDALFNQVLREHGKLK